MNVLSTEAPLIGTTTPLLPRVNLLPPEIAERASFKRVQVGLGAGLLATMGLVGLLVFAASGGVHDAQSQLNSAQAQQTTLQQQTGEYKHVTAVYAKAAAAQAQLSQAMGDEVRYSQLLNDFSLSTPSNVWLKNLSFTSTAPAAATAAGTAAADSSIGTMSATAVAFAHDDVAVWLESLAKLKAYSNPYFSNSTEALIGTRKVVNFTSTAKLTSAALSGRYNKPAGG